MYINVIIIDIFLNKLQIAYRMLNVQGLGRNSAIKTSVADGDRGTAQTIRYAKQLVAEGMVNPAIRRLAISYCQQAGAAENDELAEMNAVFSGVRRDFSFIKDPVGTELLQPVTGILETQAGDCDDLNVILLPSLLESIGYPTRAVTVKADPDRPQEFSHVYMEAQLATGQWVAMDAARSNPEFGKSPEKYWARADWPLTPGGGSARAYLNGYRRSAMRGMGASVVIVKKRAFPLRGLGQDDVSEYDAGYQEGAMYGQTQAPQAPSQAPALIAASLTAMPSILTGVAQVVKAQNTPGIAVSGVVSGNSSTLGTTAGSSSGLLILLLLLGVGAVAFSR